MGNSGNCAFLLRIGLLLATASCAFSIMCHVCDSTQNESCLDPFKKGDEFLTNCSIKTPEARFCRKITQHVHDDYRIFRRCAWVEHRRSDCYFDTAEYYKSKVCLCREDGCNSAPKPTFQWTVGVAVVVPLLLWKTAVAH